MLFSDITCNAVLANNNNDDISSEVRTGGAAGDSSESGRWSNVNSRWVEKQNKLIELGVDVETVCPVEFRYVTAQF